MTDWTRRLPDLRALMAEKLGTRGPSLATQLRRAGRRLPRRLRRDADLLSRAERMASHPRFARLIDPRDVRRAERRMSRHLRGIDPALVRSNRRKNMAAALGLYVLVTFALVVTLLWWRGYV